METEITRRQTKWVSSGENQRRTANWSSGSLSKQSTTLGQRFPRKSINRSLRYESCYSLSLSLSLSLYFLLLSRSQLPDSISTTCWLMKRHRKEPERIPGGEAPGGEEDANSACALGGCWTEKGRIRERERTECAWEEVKANGATKVSAAKSATDYQ